MAAAWVQPTAAGPRPRRNASIRAITGSAGAPASTAARATRAMGRGAGQGQRRVRWPAVVRLMRIRKGTRTAPSWGRRGPGQRKPTPGDDQGVGQGQSIEMASLLLAERKQMLRWRRQ